MKYAILAVLCLAAVAAGSAEHGLGIVRDGDVLSEPTSHAAQAKPVCSDVTPPFGTIAEEWRIPLFLYGITWRSETQELYITTMLNTPPTRYRIHKLDPADPLGTLVEVPWEMLALAANSMDIPWGIVWDDDHDCFWISQVGGTIYGGCWLVRYIWNDSAWVWAGTPADTWQVGDSLSSLALECLWTAGMAKDPFTGVFYLAPVHTTHDSLNFVALFDPYTKTYLGRLAHGTAMSERGCELIPWDSCYVLTCGWNSDMLSKRDSTGAVLEEVYCEQATDWTLCVPNVRYPDSTVWLYMTRFGAHPNFHKVSTGITWGQLGMVGVRDGREEYLLSGLFSNFVRRVLMLPGRHEADLLDITGRKAMSLQPGANDIRSVSPGIYFVRREEDNTTTKVVIQR